MHAPLVSGIVFDVKEKDLGQGSMCIFDPGMLTRSMPAYSSQPCLLTRLHQLLDVRLHLLLSTPGSHDQPEQGPVIGCQRSLSTWQQEVQHIPPVCTLHRIYSSSSTC